MTQIAVIKWIMQLLVDRFDKTDFNLTDTVIMGEDGGMYLLLNNLNT